MLLRDPGQSSWDELSFEGKAFPVYQPTNIWVTQGNSLFDALQIRALIGLNDKPIGVCVIVSESGSVSGRRWVEVGECEREKVERWEKILREREKRGKDCVHAK